MRWIGGAFAPILSGYIAETFSNIHLPFLIASILSMVSCLLLFIARRAK